MVESLLHSYLPHSIVSLSKSEKLEETKWRIVYVFFFFASYIAQYKVEKSLEIILSTTPKKKKNAEMAS